MYKQVYGDNFKLKRAFIEGARKASEEYRLVNKKTAKAQEISDQLKEKMIQ